MDDLTVDEVKFKLSNKEFSCQEKSGKSDVWQNFEEIINNEKQYTGYVICKNCLDIY